MRRASCIVWTRQGRSTGRDAEVFLVKRSPELKFLGGFHAFAGGGIEDGIDEEAAKILQTNPGYRLPCESSSKSSGFSYVPKPLMFPAIAMPRQALLDDSRAWLSIVQEFQVDPTPFIGTEIGHWITPPFSPVFSTRPTLSSKHPLTYPIPRFGPASLSTAAGGR